MEAVDPIDVLRIKTGYYTRLSLQEQESHPSLVVLFFGDPRQVDTKASLEAVDTRASQQAYESSLMERLQNQFPKAHIEPIACLDGQVARTSATEVALSRSDPQRVRIATQWVDAIAKLTWAEGRWIAPTGTE